MFVSRPGLSSLDTPFRNKPISCYQAFLAFHAIYWPSCQYKGYKKKRNRRGSKGKDEKTVNESNITTKATGAKGIEEEVKKKKKGI